MATRRTPVRPDDEPPPPNADAPLADQEPLGSAETTDSPSDLPNVDERDADLPIDADMPLDVMVERQGEAAPPAPPRRDERGVEIEPATGPGDDGIDPDSYPDNDDGTDASDEVADAGLDIDRDDDADATDDADR